VFKGVVHVGCRAATADLHHSSCGEARRSDSSVGVDVEGNPDPHSLVPRGWQRSGALAVLFTAGALVTPDRLICPDYGATTPVHRTYQTLLGLAGLAP
jgi:hypothetical protein